jgi:Fanconi anemia group I protein
MDVALKLVKASRAEEGRIYKSASRLNSYINIGSVLYTHCVVKLQEVMECHAGTAVLAVECFNELFGLVCSHHKDKLVQFLGEVGTVPIEEGLTKQLLALVSKQEELLISILSMEDEAEDEAATKKIILLLIQGLTQFTLQIPCNDACSKVLNWVQTFVREKVLSNVNHVKRMLSLLFTLEIRCKGTSQLYDHIAMQLGGLMGTVDDEEIGAHTSYSVIKTGYESAVLFLLCDTVKQILEHVDWVVLRLRAEYTAMTHSVPDRLQAEREHLKSKESDVVHQIGQCVQILNYISNLALEPGPVTDAVLKLLTHQYTSLTMLTKYFIFRCTKKNPSFQSVRFEMVVKLAGKYLSPHVYNLISHIEARQKNESGTKKKKRADPLLMKSKVLRETRCIPQLIFEMEQYEKFVIELSKKSKVNLMSYVKLSTYRDFRIKANLLQAADNQNQSVSNVANDSVVTGREGQENVHDSSTVNEPPRKKNRKK